CCRGFFFQAEDGIRGRNVTGVQTCALPISDRSDHACLVGPKGCNPEIKLKKAPTEYLKQIYFDSLIFTPEAIRHLAAQVGAGQRSEERRVGEGGSCRWRPSDCENGRGRAGR